MRLLTGCIHVSGIKMAGPARVVTRIGYGYDFVWTDKACKYLIGKIYNYEGIDVLILDARIVKDDPTLIEIAFNFIEPLNEYYRKYRK